MFDRYDVWAVPENHYGAHSAQLEVEENENGDWVKFEDVKHLLERSDNKECPSVSQIAGEVKGILCVNNVRMSVIKKVEDCIRQLWVFPKR